MSTNPTFNEAELILLLKTIVKLRNYLFDATEIKLDHRAAPRPRKYIPRWKGKRGTFPLLDDIDKSLALLRLHINKEEAIELYSLMGFFDQPITKDHNRII